MSDVLRDCRLAGIHAMVIVRGAGDIAAAFTKARIWDPEEIDEKIDEEAYNIYSYVPQFINGPEAAKLPDRRQYFAARNWPFPEMDSLFLTAINGDGRELGRLSLNVSNHQAATKDVAAFIKTHLPPRRDAKADYDAALAEAKRSRRRLWVRVGQTRCGPCFRFRGAARFTAGVAGGDFVLFKSSIMPAVTADKS